MNGMKSTPPPASLATLVQELEVSHPRVGSYLRPAEENRAAELRQYYKEHPLDSRFEVTYLDGLEALSEYLDQVHHIFRGNEQLRPIAFLIDRAAGNFVVATDATLSRFNSVVFDAMRDTMEIQVLLRDFAVNIVLEFAGAIKLS